MIVNIQGANYDTGEDCAEPIYSLKGKNGINPSWADDPHSDRLVVIETPRFRVTLKMREAKQIVQHYETSRKTTIRD